MAGKKDKDTNDLEANFFGDDADWLADEGSEELDASKPPRLTAAPPDAPYVPPTTAGRFGPAAPPTAAPRRPPMPTLPPTAGVWEELGLDKPEMEKKTAVRETFSLPSSPGEARAPALPSVPPAPPPVPPIVPPAPEPLSVEEEAPASAPDPFGEEVNNAPPRVATPAPAPSRPVENPTPAPAPARATPAPATVRVTPAPTPARVTPPPAATQTWHDEEIPGVSLNFMPRARPQDPTTLETVTDAPARPVQTPPEPAFDTDQPTQEDAVLEPDPDPAANAPAPMRLAAEPTEETTAYADDLTEQEAVPMVQKKTPAPAAKRQKTAPEAAPPPEPVAAAEPPPAPEPSEERAPEPGPLERWAPQGDEHDWREAATAIISEAAVADGEVRGRWLFAAGRLYEVQLGDRPGADAMYADAAATGFTSADLSRALARGAQEAGRNGEAATHWSAAAERSSPPEAVDALIQAASLLDTSGAIAALERAYAIDPDHYGVLCLLRDRYAEAGRDQDRETFARKVAAALDGRASADAWWEVGRLAQRASQSADALDAFERAREADPRHVPALSGIEAVVREALQQGPDEMFAAKLLSAWKAEGSRLGGMDEAWYALLSVARAPDGDAEPLLRLATERKFPFALRQWQASLARANQLDKLMAAIGVELEGATGPMRAWGLFRLGRLLEANGDVAGAIKAYEEALAADPDATPIDRALDSALAQGGQEEARLRRVEARASAVGDGVRAQIARHAAARIAASQGQIAQARATLDAILVAAPDDRSAFDRLCGLLVAQGDYHALSERLAERAAQPAEPTEQSVLLLLAALARACTPERPWDGALLTAAAHASPSTMAVLAPMLPGLSPEELLAAAELRTGEARASILALAAVALLKHNRAADARSAVERALEARPGSPVALSLLDDLARAGQTLEVGELRDERTWARIGRAWPGGMLASADAAALLSIFEADPTNPVAAAALLGAALERNDPDAALELVRVAMPVSRGDERTALLVLAALQGEILDDGDMVLEAIGAIPETSPLAPIHGLSRAAENRQEWTEAARFLATAEAPVDRLHLARLYTQRLGKSAEAEAIVRPLLMDAPGRGAEDKALRAAAASTEVLVAQSRKDYAAIGEAYAILASLATRPSVRAVTASWAARMLPPEPALAAWEMALDAIPGSTDAFDGARRAAIAIGSGEKVSALYAKYRPDDKTGLAESLEVVGDWAGAARAWEASDAEPLLRWLHLEIARGHTGDWSGVYDALTKRREACRDEGTIDAIDAKRRWVLTEKLAETDLAWDLYRQLHDDRPGDRDVTEALARIAAARGETSLATQYLRELADNAPTPEDAARYQCRIGAIREQLGDAAGARQAWLDALDHVRDDRTALDGLRRIAEQSGDHAALVAVLQREAGLVQGPQKGAVLKEIARVVEKNAEDRWVAVDAWRNVIEHAPGDREALERLIALSEGLESWDQFLESGRSLLGVLPIAERAVLLRRLGEASEKLGSADEASGYYEAAIGLTPPDLDAARRLEELSRSRGDWSTAVRCLRLLASHGEGHQKVEWLLRAAQTEAEARQDREAADHLYTEVLSLEPTNTTALRFRAEHLVQVGKHAEALPFYEQLEPKMLAEDSDDFDVRLEIGSFFSRFADLLREAGRGDEALVRYEKALALNPTHLPSLRAVGPLYFERKDWKSVERTWKQWLQLTGGQGSPDEVADVYTQLGTAERQTGGVDKAYRRFAKALEANPNHVPSLKAMAGVLEERLDWSNLLNVFNNIIYHAVSAEDVIHAYLTKGRVLDERMSRTDKAIQHYEGALAVDAENPVALLRLTEIALRKGHWNDAVVLAERGLLSSQTAPEQRCDLHVAVALGKKMLGDDAAADAAYGQAKEIDAARVPPLDVDTVRADLKKRLPLG